MDLDIAAQSASSTSEVKIFRHKLPDLPFELWAMIIGLILDPIRKPYKYVTADSFPMYLTCRRVGIFAGEVERDQEHEDRLSAYRKIRLVCRAWHQFVSSPFTRMYCDYAEVLPRENIPPAIDTSNLHIINTLFVYAHGRRGNDGWLFDHSELFTGLRQLNINVPGSSEDYWDRLQRSFPSLLSLTIDYCGPGGSLRLDKLQILHLAWPEKPFTCNFPSLKHLSVVSYDRDEMREYIYQFITGHIHQLESLLMDISPYGRDRHISFRIIREPSFWRSCPNLKTLGIHALCYRHLQLPPPPGHPLHHLRVFSWPTVFGDGSLEDTQRILDQLPQVNHITVNPGVANMRGLEYLYNARVKNGQLKLTILPKAKSLRPPKAPPNPSNNPETLSRFVTRPFRTIFWDLLRTTFCGLVVDLLWFL